MDQHLTVKEATEFTGKSESTIKRLIREISADPKHPQRSQITPSHEELDRKKKSGEPYIWKIEKELLEKRFPKEDTSEPPEQQASPNPSGGAAQDDRLVLALEKTLAVLQEELIEKNKQIAGLQERQREQNLLIVNFQEQLLLASPKSRANDEVVIHANSEEGSQREPQSEPPRRKRPIWLREFHLFGKKHS